MTNPIVASFLMLIAGVMAALDSGTAYSQQPAIKRTDLATADQSATDAGSLWIAEIAPGAATGRHTHPTPRFVYVLEGAVVLEMDGQPPRTYRAGEGFAEPPGQVHNFRNASTTVPAKALGLSGGPERGTPSDNRSIDHRSALDVSALPFGGLAPI